MNKNKDVQPFNRYYFLSKIEEEQKSNNGFYMPDSAINGSYEMYKVHKMPNDSTLPVKENDTILVMQTLVESTKILENLFFCPESAVICKL